MPFALITGASKGIGRSIAKELAARKIDVLLVARTENLLKELAVELKNQYGVEAHYLAIDLGQPYTAKKIYEWCDEKKYGINILVNNAGYGLSGDFEKYSSSDYVDMMQVNIIAPMELILLFLPELKKQNKSYILNIGSSAAYQAVPFLSMYAASKAFIVSFSRALKYELRKTNVSVTLVSPGTTLTGFSERADVPEKAIKTGEKISMTADQVARIAVKSLFKERTEVITGFITKLTVFLVWLLPKKLTERTGAGFYKKP
ncbi:MAG: SDR family NAD(P)-dependent oxidoreductase [Chitinophagales bacterium]